MATDKTTIARPYAKAAFEFALAQNALPAWSSMLQTLAQICLDNNVANLLQDPKLTPDNLRELFAAVAGKVLNEAGENFLHLLAHNRRLAVLPEIAVLYEHLRAEQEKTVEVDVASFMPLSEAQQTEIAKALKQRLQREVVLNCRVDEELLGGAVIRADDLVIDGSVRGKLRELSNAVDN